MRINRAGMDIIMEFEGMQLEAYRCPAGILTVGFGHTGDDVEEGMVINEQEAQNLLLSDVAWAEETVNDLAPAWLNENQFSALVSFVFNVGSGAFERSTLLRKLNAGDIDGAVDEFPRWNKAGGRVLGGLVRRREAEQSLFLTPPIKVHGDYYGR